MSNSFCIIITMVTFPDRIYSATFCLYQTPGIDRFFKLGVRYVCR